MNLKLTTYVFTAKKNQQKTYCTTERIVQACWKRMVLWRAHIQRKY